MAFKGRNKTTNWFRFALKVGLLATDAAVWTSLNRLLTERDDGRDSRRRQDREAMELHSRRGWSRASTLLTGVGIGIGLGMLFAPVSGGEARNAIRDRAEDVKNKWNDVTAWAGGFSQPQRRTGTYPE